MNSGHHITLTCLCSHFRWNPLCPIHKPSTRLAEVVAGGYDLKVIPR